MRHHILRLAWFGIGLVGLTLGSACTVGSGGEDPGSGDEPIVDPGGPVAGLHKHHHHHVQCGDKTCGSDEICCTSSCGGICGSKDGVCPDIQCEPPPEPCGDTTCGPNEICCSASCGICGPKGGVCPDIECGPPPGEPCGDTTCGAGEICCSPSCGICGPVGGACPQIACD